MRNVTGISCWKTDPWCLIGSKHLKCVLLAYTSLYELTPPNYHSKRQSTGECASTMLDETACPDTWPLPHGGRMVTRKSRPLSPPPFAARDSSVNPDSLTQDAEASRVPPNSGEPCASPRNRVHKGRNTKAFTNQYTATENINIHRVFGSARNSRICINKRLRPPCTY